MPSFDELVMSIVWCKHVDGSSIFPKLPVYLRLYYERWEQNQRMRDAVKNSKNELQLLEKVNNDNMLYPCDAEVRSREGDALLFATAAGDSSGACAGITAHSVGVNQTGKQLQYSSSWVNVSTPTPMMQPHFMAIRPHQLLGPPTVGGFQMIGLTSRSDDIEIRNTKRGRGKDYGRRQKRTCARCVLKSGTNGWNCNGQKEGKGGGQNAYEFFDAAGFPIDRIK